MILPLRISIVLPLLISIILPLLFILPLKWSVLNFNCLKDSNILNSIYLLRLKVLYLIDRVPFKDSFTNFFSPVRAHLFVAQKTHLERTGRYFQVDQIPNR